MPIHIEPSAKQISSEFAGLLKQEEEKGKIEEGALVKGKVIQITRDFVVVDIGYKSEGQISVSEFRDPEGNLGIKEGDVVDVLLENKEDDHGMIRLSKERADALKAWDSLVKIQEEEGLVEGVVLAKVKGGLFVDVGVKAFLPGSQIDFRPVRNLDKYVGKKLRFKILKLNKRRGNIVLSRKEALAKEQEHFKENVLQKLKVGDVLEGTVKNLTEYGAFVDLGGMDGLLHVTDMSWGRVAHPSDLFEVGDSVKVMVLRYDEATSRVSLGVKQLQEDPWLKIEGQFPVGSKVKGKVVTLTDYGAFIELLPGVEGLAHVSEISWNKKLKNPSQELTQGQEVEAIVLDCDIENRRIALGMKQLKPNPWDILDNQLPVGSKVKGTIRNITDFGIFLDCGVGVDGLIHISDLDWVQNYGSPQEIFKKGETLEVVVANVDRENERFSLSRKLLLANPWEKIRGHYAPGSAVEGKVVSLHNHGAVVDLGDGIEGLIPKAVCPEGLKAGEALSLEVAAIEEENRKFHLKPKN